MLLLSGCRAELTAALRAVRQSQTPPHLEVVTTSTPMAPFRPEIDVATKTFLTREGAQCGVPILTPYPTPVLEDIPLCYRLMLTIKDGDLAATQALLESACAVDTVIFGNTPLMLAARAGELDILTYLLQHGADVNYQKPADGDVGTAEVGQTALWYAVAEGDPAIVARLLDHGADPNLHPPDGFPLLILASVANESAEVARQLVEAGVDVNERAPTGATAMTQGNGPSAEMFVYLTSIGVATDGMAPALAESLRWEYAQRPAPDASPEQQIAYLVEVAANTQSARSREQAVLALGDFGPLAASATPTLIEIITGPLFSNYDWSGVFAVDALIAIGPNDALTAASPTLLRLLTANDGRRVRINLLHVLVQAAPHDDAVLETVLGYLRGGAEQGYRIQAAAALANLARARIAAAPTGWEVVRQYILPTLLLAHQQEYDPIVRSRILEAMQRIACE